MTQRSQKSSLLVVGGEDSSIIVGEVIHRLDLKDKSVLVWMRTKNRVRRCNIVSLEIPVSFFREWRGGFSHTSRGSRGKAASGTWIGV